MLPTIDGNIAVKSDFPWPQDDGAFKRRMHLCLLEQSPDVVTREFLLNILAEKKGRIPAGKKLTFFLSKYYSQVKAKQLLSREEILGIKFFKRDDFLLDNEAAAHDFWPLCDDTKVLKTLSDKSLSLSLSMLEEMQLRPETLKVAPVKLYELLLNSPHPEIKRRIEFIGFAQLTGRKQLDSLIKASMEKRISACPVLQVILDEAELLNQFTLMVQTGHGTLEGNLDDLAEMTKEDIIQYLNEEECAPREKSLGVRTLLLHARNPGQTVKPSRDKLLSGAIRFEAVAREFLQSDKEEIRQLFPDESHRIKLIGKHQQLAIETLRDNTFPNLSDEVKIEWAVKHRKIGWAFLQHVTDYLTYPDKLLPETLVKICQRDKENFQLLLESPGCKPLLDKLSEDDFVRLLVIHPEIGLNVLINPDLSQNKTLTSTHLCEIASKQQNLVQLLSTDSRFKSFRNRLSADQWMLLVKNRPLDAGMLLKLALDDQKITEEDCLQEVRSNPEIRAAVLQYVPALAEKIRAEIPITERSPDKELPKPDTLKPQWGNFLPFSQSRDFRSEIRGGCCAGFAIDFCLFCHDDNELPEHYIDFRDQWKAGKSTSDYMRRVRHYQTNQNVFANKEDAATINLDGTSDPTASVIHLNGKSRLDMKKLLGELYKHKGLYIKSESHAIALTLNSSLQGLAQPLYLFDANHGLYCFHDFSGTPEQIDDVEALINDWLMKTGRGMLTVEICNLTEDAYLTSGVASSR